MTRYYPGFFAAFFLILLRIAIGWHFLYEGSRSSSRLSTARKPFSAEIYLRNANGPARALFPRSGARRQRPRHARPDRAQGRLGERRRPDRRPLRVQRGPAERGREAARRGRAMGRPLVQRPGERREAGEVPPRPGPGPGDRARPAGAVVRARAGLGGAPEPGRRPQRADRPDRRARQGPARARRQGRPTSRSRRRAPLLSRLAPRSPPRRIPTRSRRPTPPGPGPARLDQRRDDLRPDRDRASA